MSGGAIIPICQVSGCHRVAFNGIWGKFEPWWRNQLPTHCDRHASAHMDRWSYLTCQIWGCRNLVYQEGGFCDEHDPALYYVLTRLLRRMCAAGKKWCDESGFS